MTSFVFPSRVSWRRITLLAFVVPCVTVAAETAHRDSIKCENEEDLDFENCNVEDLSISAIKAICARVGLDVETDVFPYLLEDEEDESQLEDAQESSIKTKEWAHSEYVSGAYECLLIEGETKNMLEDESFEDLTDDPELLAEYAAQVIETDPELVSALELEIKKEEPELWASIEKELKEDEVLSDRLDLVGELLVLILGDGKEEDNVDLKDDEL